MTVIIQTQSLSKYYGNRLAVDQLNLEVRKGDIYGFVGPNGAGKTSTIRILCTLMEASGGEAFVNGFSVFKNPRDVRRTIGYMPDFFGVYDDMKVWEYLDFFGACYGIDSAQRSGLIRDLLDLVDLAHRRDDFVDKLSRGMKQRLSLARTLVHDPAVLILDEPASGLDPRARVEIRELLLELSRMGKTIFFSTHILSDVAEICTRIGIIEEGGMVVEGDLSQLQQAALSSKSVRMTVLNAKEDIERIFSDTDAITHLVFANGGTFERTRLEFSFAGDDLAFSELVAKLSQQGLRIVQISEESQNLEEVFMRVTKGLSS